MATGFEHQVAPARGWAGRFRGRMGITKPPQVFEGSSVQVAGLFPFVTGASMPIHGAPLGLDVMTGALLCADPIAYFETLHLINNPSAFVLGKPGLGKSTLVRRMALGMNARGVMPMVLGDLKPDYVALIEAMGGQVITLGPGFGTLNVVSIRDAQEAAVKLASEGFDREARELIGDARGRRQLILSTLLELQRRAPLGDREEAILGAACEVADEDASLPDPELADVLAIIRARPERVRTAALDRDDDATYLALTDHLEASLQSLVTGGRLGRIFAGQTTTPMHLDRPVVFDVSATEGTGEDVQAAVLLAVWNYGFGQIEIANTLGLAGLAPFRRYAIILDELWRTLRVASGMVDRVDKLTRLNRSEGVGVIMISHTMADLRALKSEEDRQKAAGFVERAGMVFLGGLPAGEMPRLAEVITLSGMEQSLLVGWTDPPQIAVHDLSGELTNNRPPPPGQGKFLMKIGGGDQPGVAFQIVLTDLERELGVMNTNTLWEGFQ